MTNENDPCIDHDRQMMRIRDASIVAGRMAHDFDNILTSVVGFSDLAMPLVQGHEKLSQYINEISKAGERARLFTTQLHELSRSHNVEPQATDIDNVVVPLTQTLMREHGVEAMSIECAFPGNLRQVSMGPRPMAVLFKHLLSNALEAKPAHASVTITARNIELNDSDVALYYGAAIAGENVEITIQDHGPGIVPKIEKKLFNELFVTTKVRHRGLGLAIVYQTLAAHRGGVVLESNCAPPTGTKVRLVLPVASAQASVPSYSANPVIAFGR